MATTITINVTNKSPNLQNFFFFQQPAQYSGGAQVYTNSLYTAPLLPSSTSGAVLSFTMILQYYAGVQQQVQPPTVGQASGQLAASQPINLTPASGTPPANTTNMIVSPSLGLSVPVPTAGPQAGAFRIVTPTYNPALANYNAGSAIQTLQGGITLSNFVTAQPTTNLDCQPVIVFYVQTGTYTPGTVMNFTSSSINAAICNATPGYTTFNVTYNADGTWTVQNFSVAQLAGGQRMLVAGPDGAARALAAPGHNAQVMNEAGTAVISTGNAANPNALPMTIDNLSNPAGIAQFRDYQVGPIGGPYLGALCTAIAGGSATFV
jgi:hypothetical protein